MPRNTAVELVVIDSRIEASMRPRRDAAEYERPTGGGKGGYNASMRPRRDAAEYHRFGTFMNVSHLLQ